MTMTKPKTPATMLGIKPGDKCELYLPPGKSIQDFIRDYSGSYVATGIIAAAQKLIGEVFILLQDDGTKRPHFGHTKSQHNGWYPVEYFRKIEVH